MRAQQRRLLLGRASALAIITPPATWDPSSANTFVGLSTDKTKATLLSSPGQNESVRSSKPLNAKGYACIQVTWGLQNSQTGTIGVGAADASFNGIGELGQSGQPNSTGFRGNGLCRFNGSGSAGLHRWDNVVTQPAWVLLCWDLSIPGMWLYAATGYAGSTGGPGWIGDGSAGLANPLTGAGPNPLNATTQYLYASLHDYDGPNSRGDAAVIDPTGLLGKAANSDIASKITALEGAGFVPLSS